MTPLERTEIAACMALGLSPEDSSLRRKTVFREALKAGNLAPFQLVTQTFDVTVPVAAAVDLTRIFTGTVLTCKSPMSDGPAFEGFYRRGDLAGLFHQDSIDFEDTAEDIDYRGRLANAAAVSAGVNTRQADELLTQSSVVTLLLCGTVLDFYRLARVAGPYGADRHPVIRAISRELYTSLSTRERALFEVLLEVNP